MLNLMSFHSTARDYWYCFYLLIIHRHPRYLTPFHIFFPEFFDRNFKVDIIMISISRYINNLRWMASEDAINTCIKSWSDVSPQTANLRKVFEYLRAVNFHEWNG